MRMPTAKTVQPNNWWISFKIIDWDQCAYA
jgi:hypothetical protein